MRSARQGNWSPRYLAEVERLSRKVIEPRIGNRLLNETTRDDWVSLIVATRRTAPATGSWLYSMCSSFLNHSEMHGWVATNVLPRKGLAAIAPRVANRARILTDDELRSVWLASEAFRPKARAFIRLLVLTAARQMEVADISVAEVDVEAARWVIPASRSKNRRGIAIPLGALAMDELTPIWPQPKAGANYKLLGAIDGCGFRGFSKLKLRLDELSGVSEWRWHDLRRTARSAMSRLGVSSLAAEAALNHISGRSRLEQTYDRYDYAKEAADALTIWQHHVATLTVSVSERACITAY
jgi:integrase